MFNSLLKNGDWLKTTVENRGDLGCCEVPVSLFQPAVKAQLEMDLDVLIFGGGAAGLWLLDQLSRRGDRVLLLEGGRLGQGQTISSQGIIHGGLKYTLQGLLTPAAREIREMPDIWRQSLAGRCAPDLSHTRVRAETCHLWRSDSLRSRLGMLGARVGLHVAPLDLAAADRPAVLANCPGQVARLDEQVIAPVSFLADLASQHQQRLLQIDGRRVSFTLSSPGVVNRVVVLHPQTGQPYEFRPRQIVLTAGAGNAALRQLCGLPSEAMQKRPLHMLLLRGRLPILNGHCVDGARTRVTITSDHDAQGRTVWQVGGQLAEEGVAVDERSLIGQARRELEAVLPGIALSNCEWATYRVDRAEGAMPRGGRPDTALTLVEGNVVTAWPTKLALAPQLARMALERLTDSEGGAFDLKELTDWPRPLVALPPWEMIAHWHCVDDDRHAREAA